MACCDPADRVDHPRQLTFPNVIITGHQAFFTHQAMEQIATETIDHFSRFAQRDDQTPKALTPLRTAGNAGRSG